jgi:glycosyltransferase involved in cell wall biosynthesis
VNPPTIAPVPSPPATAISVLIRTFNSGQTLERVLAALPLVEGDELVVVDSGSTDTTLAISSRAGARVIQPEGLFNYSKSLNAGFAAARNPWVLVLSSHCIPASNQMLEWLRLEAAKADAALAVVYGQTALFRPKDAEAPPEHFDKLQWEQLRRPIGGNGLALYRRVLWEDHHFDETLTHSEDLEWFLWAINRGYCARRLPQAWALYQNRGSLRHMFRKGWFDVLNTRNLINAPGPPAGQLAHIRNLLVGTGALVKKVLLGRISPGTFLRQMALTLGAYLSSARLDLRGRSPKSGCQETSR